MCGLKMLELSNMMLYWVMKIGYACFIPHFWLFGQKLYFWCFAHQKVILNNRKFKFLFLNIQINKSNTQTVKSQ